MKSCAKSTILKKLPYWCAITMSGGWPPLPDGLSGHDIPPGSRVIAVADSIDAMMSSRSYRPAMTSAACRREIEKNSGIMYDPRVAAAALEHWDELVSRYAGADTPRTPYFDRFAAGAHPPSARLSADPTRAAASPCPRWPQNFTCPKAR